MSFLVYYHLACIVHHVHDIFYTDTVRHAKVTFDGVCRYFSSMASVMANFWNLVDESMIFVKQISFENQRQDDEFCKHHANPKWQVVMQKISFFFFVSLSSSSLTSTILILENASFLFALHLSLWLALTAARVFVEISSGWARHYFVAHALAGDSAPAFALFTLKPGRRSIMRTAAVTVSEHIRLRAVRLFRGTYRLAARVVLHDHGTFCICDSVKSNELDVTFLTRGTFVQGGWYKSTRAVTAM